MRFEIDSTDQSGGLYPCLGKVKFNFAALLDRETPITRSTKLRIDVYLYVLAQVISTYVDRNIRAGLKSQFPSGLRLLRQLAVSGISLKQRAFKPPDCGGARSSNSENNSKIFLEVNKMIDCFCQVQDIKTYPWTGESHA